MDVMLDHEDGHSGIADRPDERHGSHNLRGIQSAHHLVEADHLGFGGQSARDLQPLELAD